MNLFGAVAGHMHNVFHKRSFAGFLLVSGCLHLAVLLAIPASGPHRPAPRTEVFDVDLMPLAAAAAHVDARTPALDRHRRDQTDKKSPAALKAPAVYASALPKEATVSLYGGDRKYDSYLAHLRQAIDAAWHYPADAKERKTVGSLTLHFSIGTDGRLLEVKLLEPSGHRILDRAALAAVRTAAPFRKLPARLALTRLNVLATFTYQFSDAQP